MSQRTVGMPEINKLKEIVQLQANLWDTAHRLPDGANREGVLQELGGFQNRIVALVRRLNTDGV